jgi:hypothetical protein
MCINGVRNTIIANTTILLLCSISTASSSEEPKHLWTVQAVAVGDEIVCDAFASGAMERPPYEFRFRRSKGGLLLILSYDGPKVINHKPYATIIIDDSSNTFPAKDSHFGNRNAFLISLDPSSVDFHIFDHTAPFQIAVGATIFNLATLPDDDVYSNYNRCLEAVHLR